jgi:UDP-3-O-[3-hydroxymyristoyl] glucosamine N-acyltransferase
MTTCAADNNFPKSRVALKMKLRDIAARLSCDMSGDGTIEIFGVAGVENAREGELSFLVNPKYFPQLKHTQASGLIVGVDFPDSAIPLLRHKNPYLAFAKAIELFRQPEKAPPGVHPTAIVSPEAILGEDVAIGAYSKIGSGASIGNRVQIGSHSVIQAHSVIGEDSVLQSGCVIRQRVRIGKRCIIQSNAVIGSDGFGYAKQEDGSWYKIIQSGTVVVEDDVEIGAATTIDRATVGETWIGQGTKVDNRVHIGHGCQIGKNCLICAQVGLAGSTRLGDNVILAGQVGAAGHLTIGDGVIAIAQTGIPSSVEPGKTISGSPAIDQRTWLKSSAIHARLPELNKHLRDLERRVRDLEKIIKATSELMK